MENNSILIEPQISYPPEHHGHGITNTLFVAACGVALSTAIFTVPAYNFAEVDTNVPRYAQVEYTEMFGDSFSIGNTAFSLTQTFDFCAPVVFCGGEDISYTIYEQTEEQVSMLQEDISMLNKRVPVSFVVCVGLFAALFLGFTRALFVGLNTGKFLMNPLYMVEIAFGFLGLAITAIVAIVEWRMKRGWKQREEK